MGKSQKMKEPDSTVAATELLLVRALQMQSDIEDSIDNALIACQELTVLLREEESLREAADALQGKRKKPSSASHPSTANMKRSERAARCLRDLENLSRSTDAYRRRVSRAAQRISAPKVPSPPVSELHQVARANQLPDGRIRVQDVTEAILNQDPDRYSSAKSAYAAIYDQMRRSREFEHFGPGVFTLVAEFERQSPGDGTFRGMPFESWSLTSEDSPDADGRPGEMGTRSTDPHSGKDLPFE